jgi:hypothetical protein
VDKIAAYNAVLQNHPLWTKVAAPRHIREIRKLVQAGDFEGARRLTKMLQDAGALKTTLQGTQLKHLGSGVEGVGTLVVGAKDAPAGELAVRKAYDRGGAFFNKENLAEKHNIMRRAKNHPNFAKTYSSKIRKGKGGTPYTIGEFIEGTEDITGQAGDLARLAREGKGATEFSAVGGVLPGAEFGVGNKKVLGDVIGIPGNTIITPEGVPKMIDVMPTTAERIQAFLSGTSPNLRRMQRLVGLPEITEAPANMDQVLRRRGELMKMLESDPEKMRRMQALASRAFPAQAADVFGATGVGATDVTPLGVRKASRRRALSGL